MLMNIYIVMSDNSPKWNCKCGCISKQSHRSRWAFISKHKCNHFIKRKNLFDDKQTNIV